MKLKKNNDCTACLKGDHDFCEEHKHTFCDCWRLWHRQNRAVQGTIVETKPKGKSCQ